MRIKLNHKYVVCSFIALLILFTQCISSQPYTGPGFNKPDSDSVKKLSSNSPASLSESEIWKKIDDLLSRMTLEEKIGQLNQHAGVRNGDLEPIKNGGIGSFLGVSGAYRVNELQEIAVKQSRLGIPLIIGSDVIHGYHTTFPIPLAQACSWDTSLIKQACSIAAEEASLEGINWTFAPMVDIARDPRWGRIAEGAGEDPFLCSAISEAEVEGFQGVKLNGTNLFAACAKHYVAYGAAEAGKDYNTVDISEKTLREIYLPPFYAAVKAGVFTIMSAFNSLNGVPASANYFTLTKILKQEWGFKGFVVSDYDALGDLVNHGIAANKTQAALKAITAGVDMDMVGDTAVGNIYYPNLAMLVKQGRIPESAIDESVKRILWVKYKLGLFEHPYVDSSYYADNMPSQEFRDSVALRLSQESIVLLKNRDSILPLNKNIKSIAVIGPLADDKEDLSGPWAGKPETDKFITVLGAIKKMVTGNTKITYAKGCGIEDSSESGINEAVNLAKQSDAVILVIGESREMSGEASSRANIGLPGAQEYLAERIHETGVPVIAVLMNGRPLTISRISEHVNAILETWFLGEQAGNAIAGTLFGRYNPSGKLPVTFPRSVGQIPIYYNHLNTGRPPVDTDRYTSKYLDEPVTPLYPFGYGLSYTTFIYSNLELDKTILNQDDSIIVSVKVTNTGMRAGFETTQLYIRDLTASVSMPVKELKGFKRIFLQPGESSNINFTINPNMLEFYNIDMHKTTEPGTYNVMIGGNSDDVLAAAFKLNN